MSKAPVSILYLEDDSAISELVLLALSSRDDMALQHVVNGEEAVTFYGAARPDLMLFDIMVPNLDGIDAAHQIKDQYKDKAAPVIFMTANTQAQDQIASVGALGYIAKPFDILTLGDQVLTMYNAWANSQSCLRLKA